MKADALRLYPMPFFFVRHGESTWNAARRVQGQSDVPLSEAGLAQAHEAAARIAGQPVGALFASPLQRARRTAEIINAVLGLPMSLHDDLMEARLGVLEGKSYEAGLGDWYKGVVPEGAETREAFYARAIAGLNRILAAWDRRDTHPLIVAHGGIFRAIQEHALRSYAWEVRNCCPVLVRPPEQDGWAWTMEEL
jgi:probable phosphoglycerate mutase